MAGINGRGRTDKDHMSVWRGIITVPALAWLLAAGGDEVCLWWATGRIACELLGLTCPLPSKIKNNNVVREEP